MYPYFDDARGQGAHGMYYRIFLNNRVVQYTQSNQFNYEFSDYENQLRI